jgi:hypothetical protein
MINLDDRILDGSVTESEMWLLLHITKFIGKNMVCWPSNKTLLERTGWSMGKLQSVKKALQQKGILEISERKNESGQTSNNYKLKTKYISVFVNVGEKEFIEESYPPIKNQVGVGKKPTPLTKNDYGPLTKNEYASYQNSSNEVLNNEVLNNEVLINENNSAKAPFSEKEHYINVDWEANGLDFRTYSQYLKYRDWDKTTVEEKPAIKITFNSMEEKTPINKIPDTLKKPLTYTKEDFLSELEQKGVGTWYDSFKNVWGEYIRHRKELRKPYKSAKSAAIGFKELLELSNYNVEAGIRLVERSIANGWQGLHPEKQKAKSEGKSKVQEQHEDLVTYVMNKRNLLNG